MDVIELADFFHKFQRLIAGLVDQIDDLKCRVEELEKVERDRGEG